MNHSFDIELAQKYGVNEAIFIENLRFWIAKNKANNRHFYDGSYWTYNSMKAYAELFPYWTTNQVRRIIESLVSHGVIVVGNHNQNPYDRTQWYTLNSQIEVANLPNGSDASAKSTNTYINTEINTVTKPKASPVFVLPDWIPLETWDAFMEVRKATNAKGTDYAKKLILNQLAKYKESGYDPVDIINTSIRNSWKDVYEPKAQSSQRQQPLKSNGLIAGAI